MIDKVLPPGKLPVPPKPSVGAADVRLQWDADLWEQSKNGQATTSFSGLSHAIERYVCQLSGAEVRGVFGRGRTPHIRAVPAVPRAPLGTPRHLHRWGLDVGVVWRQIFVRSAMAGRRGNGLVSTWQN